MPRTVASASPPEPRTGRRACHPLARLLLLACFCLEAGNELRAASDAPLRSDAQRRDVLRAQGSPCLAAHADDPVSWQPWGAPVLEEARRRDVPVFLSIGYHACHWCHVLHQESFLSPRIAARLNADFVPVKVDREQEPVLDAWMLRYARETRGVAGWPLNIVLTPQGDAFYSMIYAPPSVFEARLAHLARLWREDAPRLTRLAAQARERLSAPFPEARPAPRDNGPALRAALREALLADMDTLQGGFGRGAKFPHAPRLMLLLELFDPQDAPLREALVITLEHMADGALHDAIGGGFFRYTVDPGWQWPHFEKMLYDNAQLARVYLRAGRLFGREDWLAIGRQTLEFMESALQSEGLYISALSALDTLGREGGHYLWDAARLTAALGDQAGAARAVWLWVGDAAVAGELPLPRSFVPRDTSLSSLREKMRAYRERVPAPRDDKRLCAWNGLALSAHAEALRLWPEDTRLRAVGVRLAGALRRDCLGPEGRVWQQAGMPHREGALADRAYVAAGLADWARYSADKAARDAGRAVVSQGWRAFYREGAFRAQESAVLPYLAAWGLPDDDALPSPAAELLRATRQLEQTPPAGLPWPAFPVSPAERIAQGSWVLRITEPTP